MSADKSLTLATTMSLCVRMAARFDADRSLGCLRGSALASWGVGPRIFPDFLHASRSFKLGHHARKGTFLDLESAFKK